ncbi:MAG: phytanoyl-CoA dioxygenase family protein [Phycisphaerae bacterium]
MKVGHPSEALAKPYSLSDAQIDAFKRDGFIKLRGVFDAETLGHYGDDITKLTLVHDKYKDVPLEQRSTYAKAFIQVTNLWRMSERAREFSFAPRVARIAAELLEVSGVRMWHDQALYKEAGGGFTPWHVDQQYWPMSSDRCVTAWIPLQAVAMNMGPLSFGIGSHNVDIARTMEISDESERYIQDAVARLQIAECFEPYELGEVSFHLGWTLHRAGPNTSQWPRRVHTVIYMDENMRLATEMTANQRVDWEAFSPSTKPGEVMRDELNPVLWSR